MNAAYDPTKHPLVGRRVRLLRCTDPCPTLKQGDMGTVVVVDCLDTVHVDWDNGSRLGLCEEAGDLWEVEAVQQSVEGIIG